MSRSCPAPFFVHPDVYPCVLAAPTCHHAIAFVCRPRLHIEPSATQDDSPRPKHVSFDGAELAQVFEADEWDRSPVEVTLRLTYKDVVKLRELNVSLVRNGPLMMECTPSRRPTRQHCTFSGRVVRSHRTGPSRHHVMVMPHPTSPRPHHWPLPRRCPTWPPHQPTPSKHAGVPCPGSLHVPSPRPRATDMLPFRGTLTHTVPMRRPTPHAYQCADGQPPRMCPGPSDSLAPSRHAGAIQVCLAHPSHAPAPAMTSRMRRGPLQRIPATPDAPRASPMCYGPYPRAPAGPMRHTLVSSRIPTQLRDLGHHLTCPAIPSASHNLWPHHAALRVALYHAHEPCPTSPRYRRPSSPMPSSGWPLHRLPYSSGPTSAASITSAAPLS